MVQTQVRAQGWLGSTPEGRRPQIRGLRAGGSLAVASSTPATPLLPPAKVRELNHFSSVRTLHFFLVRLFRPWMPSSAHGTGGGPRRFTARFRRFEKVLLSAAEGINPLTDLRLRQGQAHEDQQGSKRGKDHRPGGMLRNIDGEPE